MSQVSSKPPRRPKVWRNLAELSDPVAYRERTKNEFDAAPDEGPTTPGRRRFMQLMGASLALSGCRFEKDYVLPHTKRPEGLIPGKPLFYATAMELGGVAWGVVAKSYEGRPIKVEGNPKHPGGNGGSNAYQQAATLELYDPDRSLGVAQMKGGRKSSSWQEFEAFAKPHFAALKGKGGAGLAVLAQPSSSETRRDMKRRLLEAFPQAKWYEWAPLSNDNDRAGSKLAYGKPHRTHYRMARAAIVVALDADLFGTHPDALNLSRAFASRRDPEKGPMARLYAFESTFSSAGAAADHRVPLRSAQIKALAAYLDATLSPLVSAPGAAQPKPNAPFLSDEKVAKVLKALVDDLVKNRGRSVIAAGAGQPPEVHALVHRLNAILGNVGRTVVLSEDAEPEAATTLEQVQALVKSSVDTLLVLGGNPAYDAPADVDFKGFLGKVPHAIHLALHEDETSELCEWHLPEAHWLEAWGDARSYNGTICIAQPLIAPLFAGKTASELLAMVNADPVRGGLDLVKRALGSQVAGDALWKKVIHDGFVPGSAFKPATPTLSDIKVTVGPESLGGLEVPDQLELVLSQDSKLYDGRYANNGWLQELPDTAGKLTWDNAAFMGPATAKKLGVTDQDVVQLAINGASLSIPVLQVPGLAAGTVQVALGYGRSAAGRIGGSKKEAAPTIGSNSYQLMSTKLRSFGAGLQVKKAGGTYKLATTQDKHSIDELGKEGIAERIPTLARSGTYKKFKKDPEFAKHVVHHPPLLSLWEEPVTYDGYKWGMTIDLNKCVGCGTCTTACQAENNIPVVGKERVLFGRELHWIRVDRYYMGDENNPEMVQQPLTCHQCEHAPCEQVCPVGATMHSSEGLNDMVYNRCIGTRYCANNCPYKVRRFNYFNYHMDMKEERNKTKGMVFNPEVTVRFRGVMEKCTFCVQRIQNTKIDARNNRRKVADGEIQTACQQACPTDAIVFGDLNDKKSKVLAQQNSPRAYAMLGQLNVRPRLLYLAKITNPHPDLEPVEKDDGHGGGHAAAGHGDGHGKDEGHSKESGH